MAVLMDVRQDIGGLLQAQASFAESFKTHVEEDKQIGARLTRLELTGATQAGKTSVWMMVVGAIGGLIGTIIGAAASYFARHGS